MKIGIRVPARTSGGGHSFYTNLQAALERSPRCNDVTIFRMSGGKTNSGSEVIVDTPGGAVSRRLLGPRRLSEAVGTHPVDVMLSAGTEVSRIDGVPGVFWPLTVAPFEEEARRRLGASTIDRLRWRALRSALSSACGSADAYVFSSYYAEGLYRDRVRAVRDRPAAVIPPAPTADMPSVPCPVKERGTPFLLFVSHVYPYKMLLEVIEAHAAVLRQGIDLDLVVAGSLVHHGYAEQVKSSIRAHMTADRVHLLGAVHGKELGRLYRDAWAFVFPSVSENAGSYALIDAFSVGLPVLSSGFSSLPEACQDAARYFDPRVPRSLATEIVRLHEDSDAYADLAARSARHGMNLPTWDGIADALIEFLRSGALAQGTP